jgi:3-dehydroquinate synthase
VVFNKFMTIFKIQNQTFSVNAQENISAGFTIKSSPRPYKVSFSPSGDLFAKKPTSSLLLADRKVYDLYLKNITELQNVPTFLVDAVEEAKEIKTVLEIVDFLEKNSATKTSMLYVVGGGIIQDLGAFSGSMYKRGLPWTFVPTTLLAQGDSGVGGKTALNHQGTKNLLALFSAPRELVIDAEFLKTLSKNDILSGVGEIFRLCITGGNDFLKIFIDNLQAFLQGDAQASNRLVAASILVKRAIVEFDEFELDIRRSMNYGHSFGHALEALSNYQIPHGIGVTIGILVENEISYGRKMLQAAERNLLLDLGKQIIPADVLEIFANTPLDGILTLFKRDKKTEGTTLKLATLESIGDMRFINFVLDESGEKEVRKAVTEVLKCLQ